MEVYLVEFVRCFICKIKGILSPIIAVTEFNSVDELDSLYKIAIELSSIILTLNSCSELHSDYLGLDYGSIHTALATLFD